MRFMMIVKASKDSEAGILPGEDILVAMGKFNEEMVKAGVLVDATGLQASSKGARVKFAGDKRIVTDGPFTETKDLIAGYWIIEVKSRHEAIEWAKRSPNPHPGQETEIEIRQVFEAEDFGPNLAPEVKEQEARLRAKIANR
jgi:hypothetical protein